jgi:hypothetical protein
MSEVAAWFRTRIAQPRIAALCLVVLAACIAADPVGPFAWTLAASAALVAQFRLWDDLEDVAHDRVRAPQRVLARSATLRPFGLVLAASIALVLIAVGAMQGWLRAGAYALLVLLLGAVYRVVAPAGRSRALRAALVLLKYPTLVLLLAADPAAPRALAAALALYAVLAVHEWRDREAG